MGDIGGTNCRVGIATPGEAIKSEIIPTPQDPDEFFNLLGSKILEFTASDRRITSCTIGLPGLISREEEATVQGIQVPGLSEPFNVRDRLAAEQPGTTNYTINILNDAEAASLAAAEYYASLSNKNPLLYLGIGTGVGSDVCVNNEALSYSAGLLVELAYMPFRQPDGSYATLGSRINGRALSELYGEGSRGPEELFKDPDTLAWCGLGADVARAIGVAAPILGFSHVVIGGGIGINCRSRIEQPLKKEMELAFDAVDPSINVKPAIDFVDKRYEHVLGLRGCYLATRQRFVSAES